MISWVSTLHTRNKSPAVLCCAIFLWLVASPGSASVCDALPDETSLATGGMAVIEAVWDEHIEEGHFKSPAPLYQETGAGIHRVNTEITIAWARLLQPAMTEARASIVLANGRADSYLKYKELAVTLWCRGYSIYMMDHRGQGLSSRILVYDKSSKGASDALSPEHYINRGHVESFDFYTQDLQHFVEREAGIPTGSPKVLLGHSLGGGIGARLIQTAPYLFDAAILSAPMLDLPSRTLGCPAVDYVIEEAIGEDAYAPGRAHWDHAARYPYRSDPDFNRQVARHFTSSQVRFDLWHELYAEPALSPDGRLVDLRIGGATTGWLDQACTGVDAIRDDISKIRIPVLLIIAEDDSTIPPERQEAFCTGLRTEAKGDAACHRHLVTGARHDILIERDFIRDQVMNYIDRFMEDRVLSR